MAGVSNPAFEDDTRQSKQTKNEIVRHDHNEAKSNNAGNGLTVEQEKFAILKNVIVISVAFMFLFTSYNSMSFLQSSINKVEGTASLTILYAAFVFSCCFLPTWMIKRLHEKYTMAACMLCYSTYMAAQFYPRIYTLVPTAVVVGLGAAPMWSAKCTYLTKSGKRLAELEGVESEVVITRFFGLFFLFFQSTQVWGNVISSTVLSVGIEKNKTAEELLTCGYNFCLDQRHEDSPSNATASTDGREDSLPLWKIYTMASIYLGCSLLAAAITVFFVDPLSRFVKESPTSQEKSGLVLVAATFNQLRHPYQLLIIPLTIWSGVEQAFLGADYTAAFVSCGLGVHMVGYVIICYGVCDAICSVGFSPIIRKYGRVPVFSLGFLINLGLNITLTYWTPKPDDLVVFFVISGLWGVADAVWQTQINTLYGVIFPGESEAAFSNYRLWESTGFIIAYACSTVLCVSSKIVVLNVFLVLGIVGYYVIEILEKRGGLEKDKDGKVVVLDRLFLRVLKKGRASV
ncbi:UNC93-like protein [Penaeus chinensis]|uniref:UNC93-like protein n=1 Tax=Penaeus chinensis TaxID=139456 RepID=UPI001FB645D6|nr:UNC93-like protein [Penaeus chinensis]XP_047502894.1 UNC93-like protein [Penaeus chinensis]